MAISIKQPGSAGLPIACNLTDCQVITLNVWAFSGGNCTLVDIKVKITMITTVFLTNAALFSKMTARFLLA